ncbi:MAG: phosphate acetyltransferase [Gammaproteobacteria bacterium]|nr:phosphate acetyltransferase [Gammaproteobacteria bacterium]
MNNSLLSIKKNNAPLRNIVLAEGEDARVIEAAVRATSDELAHCTLVGNREVIQSSARKAGLNLDGIRIEDPATSALTTQYAASLHQLRATKGMTLEQASQLVKDPLHFADLMLQAGEADGSIAGAQYTTGDRVRTALQIIGVTPGFKTVSSFMLMVFDADHHEIKQRMIFSDCALVVNPTAEQLAEIAIASTESAKRMLDEEPRVAMLSFSTNGSANHELVDKVREATRLVKQALPDLAIDGEIQLDAAIVPSISAHKMPDSKIKGRANVLIFPDLNAANIGYKLTQRFGGAKAIGPIMQGLNKPANDLSRGCSAEDVYNLIGLTAMQA